MAERRIAEKTGQGIVCFISNYSWLDGLSFTGMRERYLEAFDTIRIDCLNGDKYKTGKTTPDGAPDPSIFSTPEDPVGIQVGTAITTLVRKAVHAPAGNVSFRHLWGQAKRTGIVGNSGNGTGGASMNSSRRSCCWACLSHPRRSAKTGSTGPRSPNSFQCRFGASILAVIGS